MPKEVLYRREEEQSTFIETGRTVITHLFT